MKRTAERETDLLEGESEEEVVPEVPYAVTSYGSDPEVEGLVRRIQRGDILIPSFQRDYVWKQPEASRFIESLLFGLPVPGFFFATDPISSKQVVIDGQQRLKSLLFFYGGFFNPRPDEPKQRVFTLTKVQRQFEGKTYKTLEESDRIRLDTSIIHAPIIKQTSPQGSDTSLYHIFDVSTAEGEDLLNRRCVLHYFMEGSSMQLKNLMNSPLGGISLANLIPDLKIKSLFFGILRFTKIAVLILVQCPNF